MTPAQEKFLRELAEKLGWHEIHRPPCNGMWFVDGEIWPLSRLITADGMMYLIKRAKEERGLKEVRTYYYDNGVVEASLMQGVGTGPMFIGQADTAPWAVALAVGRAFGVELEEE